MPEYPVQKEVTAKFEALLAPVLGIAYGTAFRMTRSSEEAEDLVQDAALQAFRAFAQFQEGTNFKAWFFKIMLNLFRNKYQKSKRGPVVTPLDDAPELYLYYQVAHTELARNSNPAELIIEKMSEEQIHAAIAALPADYQMVAALYFMQELEYQEIADILGCPLGTVRSRLHRSRKLLQKALWQVAEENHLVTGSRAESERQEVS